MKLIFAIVGAAIFCAAAYTVVTRLPPEEHLEAFLQSSIEPRAEVSVNGCDLFIVADTIGADNALVASSRSVIRADMRNYDFETVQLVSRGGRMLMIVERGPTTTAMIDQATDILDAAGGKLDAASPDRQAVRTILESENGSLSFQAMAEIKIVDGERTLIASAGASDFFEFSRTVESLAAPASYQSVTAYSPGGPSADTLLTGQVIAVPNLQFSLDSQATAKELGQAIFNYVVSSNCA